MLGSDCHNILTSKEHISAFAEELRGFDYDLVLTSHYVPEGADAVETKIAYLEKALELADACADAASFIGAGAGLSTSAGFTYSGERFEKYFGDFIALYGFSDMYSGGFHSQRADPSLPGLRRAHGHEPADGHDLRGR